MLSKLEGITLLVVFALVVFFLCVWASRSANSFLERDIKYLVFSTSFIGTCGFFLSFFAIPFGMRQIERWWYEPYTYMPGDFVIKTVFVLSPATAGFFMVAWQVLVHRRRRRTP